MKAILIKSFLLIEVVLFWTVILPVAALFALGIVIRKRTLWWKTQRSFATRDTAAPTPGRLAVPTAPANRAGGPEGAERAEAAVGNGRMGIASSARVVISPRAGCRE